MKIRSVLFASTILLMTAAGHAKAAGFDCAQARSDVEKLICADSELSGLDSQLNEMFTKIEGETRGVDGETGKLIDPAGDEQARWLKTVRDVCKSTTCLRRAYQSRLADMRKIWSDALGPETASPAGSYTKKLDGDAALALNDKGNGQWEARIEAGGIPNGGATAADCNFLASGQISDNIFHGEITFANWVENLSDGEKVEPGHKVTIKLTANSADVAESGTASLCGAGSGEAGHYEKK